MQPQKPSKKVSERRPVVCPGARISTDGGGQYRQFWQVFAVKSQQVARARQEGGVLCVACCLALPRCWHLPEPPWQTMPTCAATTTPNRRCASMRVRASCGRESIEAISLRSCTTIGVSPIGGKTI